MGITLNVLGASEGDCIIIKILEDKKVFNIIVDSGVEETYFDNGLKEEITRILYSEDENIDLMILTHIDDDHIEGIKTFFEDDAININLLKGKIKNIWFNSARVIADFCDNPVKDDMYNRQVFLTNKSRQISKSNANSLEKQIEKLGISLSVIRALDKYYIGKSCCITILSPNEKAIDKLHLEWPPDEESKQVSGTPKDYDKSISDLLKNDKFTSKDRDKSVPNGASIAFILESDGKRILMLGDSHENVIRESLAKLEYSKVNKLKVDLVKLSHHGSERNTSPQLLEMLDCDKYIISTDGSLHGLPRKKCIARIINSSSKHIKLYFNYDLKNLIFGSTYEEEKKEHIFEFIRIDNSMEV